MLRMQMSILITYTVLYYSKISMLPNIFLISDLAATHSFGDVVAQGMWWLRGCGGSGDVVALGDVVAQLIKATGFHLTATQQFWVRSRLPPHSPEGRQELWLCMKNKS
jgi:hypothetical protein